MTINNDIKQLEHDKFVDIADKPAVRVTDAIANSLVPSEYDYIGLSDYSGSNAQTIVFKKGGSSGTTIATITLAYDGSGNLTSVTKT